MFGYSSWMVRLFDWLLKYKCNLNMYVSLFYDYILYI